MTPREKDAIGRAILRERRSVERFLRRIGLPEREIPDLALDAASITWRQIHRGRLVLPDDPGARGVVLRSYMRVVAFNKVREQRHAGDITLRAVRADDVEPERISNPAQLDAALELASALRAQPPKTRRFLLVLLDVETVHAAGRALGLPLSSAYETFRGARERATGKRRPGRGRNRIARTREDDPSTRELFAEGLRRTNVRALMEAEEEYGDDVERELADLEAQGFAVPRRADPIACTHPDDTRPGRNRPKK